VQLSIVTTLYRSAPYIEEFYRRIKAEAEKLTKDYEIVFVNDGSPDHVLSIALSLYEKDPCVVVVDLSRNFGHHKAMMTGLAHASGDLVYLTDVDLEDPPELLGDFYEKFLHADADVIFGVQKARTGSWFRRFSGMLFYRMLNFLSDVKIPVNPLAVRLMSRRYVVSLLAHAESELMIAGLWQLTGYKQIAVEVERIIKEGTTYTLPRRISLFVRSVTSFSRKPLVYVCVLGAIILVFASLYIAYLLAIYLFLGKPPEGYTSLIVSIWFLGGLLLFCQGIIGLYISVIFVETKNRPYTIVRQLYKKNVE
jgi:putative glycosyltransferase